MNVVLPEKPKILNRRNVTYVTVLIVCIVAIAIAIYQFFSEEKLGVIIGISKDENQEISELKEEFTNIFTNELQINQKEQVQELKKQEEDKNIVFTKYEKDEKSLNNYELNINIPYINISNNKVDEFNEEIDNIFTKAAENVENSQDRNIIYTVNYMANIENNILSVGILATFKEGNNVQRTILKTYNYNLKENKEVNLNDFRILKNIDNNTLQTRIESEIRTSQEQATKMKELGYDIYSRNLKDEIYKVENTSNYFWYEEHLYLIYAYGNNNNTSEMDIVII
ncbi:MAG: hypothetical protein IKF17_01120 [Clostridia bacterium]|nr:hypothetical protein [Clostridia bacterium]